MKNSVFDISFDYWFASNCQHRNSEIAQPLRLRWKSRLNQTEKLCARWTYGGLAITFHRMVMSSLKHLQFNMNSDPSSMCPNRDLNPDPVGSKATTLTQRDSCRNNRNINKLISKLDNRCRHLSSVLIDVQSHLVLYEILNQVTL